MRSVLTFLALAVCVTARAERVWIMPGQPIVKSQIDRKLDMLARSKQHKAHKRRRYRQYQARVMRSGLYGGRVYTYSLGSMTGGRAWPSSHYYGGY